MPSHSYDSCFSRDSSSCAALVEHHCNCLAIERAKEILEDGTGLDGGFVGAGIADEGGELGGGKVVNREEVSRCERGGCRC